MKIKASVIACCLSFNFLSLSMQCQPQLYLTAGNNAQVEMCMTDKDMTELMSEIEKMPSSYKGIVKDIRAKCYNLSLEEKQLVFNHLVVFKDSLLTKRREFRDELQVLFPRYDYMITLYDPILKNDIQAARRRQTRRRIVCNIIPEIAMNVACMIAPASNFILLSSPLCGSVIFTIAFLFNIFSSFWNVFGKTSLEKVTSKKIVQVLGEDEKLFNGIETLVQSCNIENEASLNSTIPLLVKLYSSDLSAIEMNAKKLLGYRFVKLKDKFSMNKTIVKLKPYNMIDFLCRKTCNPELEKRCSVPLCCTCFFAPFFSIIGNVSSFVTIIPISILKNLRYHKEEPRYKKIAQPLVSAIISLDLIAFISVVCRNFLLSKGKKLQKDMESSKTIDALLSVYKDNEAQTIVKLYKTLTFVGVIQDEQFLYSSRQEAKLPVFLDIPQDLMADMEMKNHWAPVVQDVNGVEAEVLEVEEAPAILVQEVVVPKKLF